METKDLLDELSLIFRKVLKREDIELNSETTAQDIEGWDSLTNMILVNEMEKKFGVRFTFRDIVRLKNVGDMCNAIQAKMK
jgi:acyl carrier protein